MHEQESCSQKNGTRDEQPAVGCIGVLVLWAASPLRIHEDGGHCLSVGLSLAMRLALDEAMVEDTNKANVGNVHTWSGLL